MLFQFRRMWTCRRELLPALFIVPLLLGNSGGPSHAQETPPASTAADAFKSVSISGNKAITTKDLQSVVQTLKPAPGQAHVTIADVVGAFQKLYRKRGYTMAQVTEAEVGPDGILRLVIAEGVIRQIIVRGNTRTRVHTIRQVLSTHIGDVYNEEQVRRDRMRLGRLGIFADISVAPQVPGSPDETDDKMPGQEDKKQENKKADANKRNAGKDAASPAPNPPTAAPAATAPPPAEPLVPPEDMVGSIDLIVRVKDQPTVNIAATVGYTDRIGAVGFLDLSENNLLGTGHRVALEWQRTAQTAVDEDGNLEATDSRSAVGFAYEVPPLGTRSLAFGAEIYNRNTVFLPYFAGGRETIRTYERRRGEKGRIGKLFSDTFAGYLTVRHDRVGYDPIPDNLNPPLDEVDNAEGTVGALGIDLVADGRDAIDTPQHGYRHEFQFERAAHVLGGNRVFSQATLDLRQYTPVFRSSAPRKNTTRQTLLPVVAARFIGGYSSGDVPLSEQFFLGGFDLLRGYDLFSVRGDRFLLSTVELRVPVGPGLQAVGFTDLGNAWLPGQSVSLNDLKGAVGLGLRFLSPIGPIRLDAAYGSRLQTYISLGQSF